MVEATRHTNSKSNDRRHGTIQTFVLNVAAGLVVVLGGFAPIPGGLLLPSADWTFTAVSLVLVATALAFRVRYPLTILVVCVAVAAVAPFWTTSSLGYLTACAIAMYRFSTFTIRRSSVIAAVISMVVLVASALTTSHNGTGYSYLLPPLSIIAVAAALGDATRNRRAYIGAIIERARTAEETRELEAQRRVTEERLRIARELHDAAAHQIAAISLHAAVASNALRSRPDDAEKALEVIRASTRGVLSEISALLRVLRSSPNEEKEHSSSPALDRDAVNALVKEFETSGLTVERHTAGNTADVSGAVGVVAYRIIQEGLANALKHGPTRRADLRLAVETNKLRITVTNPIESRGSPRLPESGRHGLVGIRERVESVRGVFETITENGEFCLHVELPLHAEQNNR